MIGLLNGILKFKYEGMAIIECGGVGYEVFLTNGAFVNLPNDNENVEILTYLNVREDGIFLFGFENKEEKALFMQLITVSGIGPKTALQILSAIKLSDLIACIANEDVKFLSTFKGIGKKTAERIVLELRDKLNPYAYIGVDFDQKTTLVTQNALNDAVLALTALGLSGNEATKIARSVAASQDTAEQIIEKVLKNMR